MAAPLTGPIAETALRSHKEITAYQLPPTKTSPETPTMARASVKTPQPTSTDITATTQTTQADRDPRSGQFATTPSRIAM
jgi:hypothetical protein